MSSREGDFYRRNINNNQNKIAHEESYFNRNKTSISNSGQYKNECSANEQEYVCESSKQFSSLDLPPAASSSFSEGNVSYFQAQECQDYRSSRSFTCYYSASAAAKYRKNRPKQKHLPQKRLWQFTDYGNMLHDQTKRVYENPTSKNSIENKLPNGFRFKLASYNLLAPDLVDKNYELYTDLNQNYLNWDYRKNKIYHDMKYLNADIYCLQEMQQDQFYEYFMPKLAKLGYKCTFLKRTNEDKLDGCAVCFKSNKFELIQEVRVRYFLADVDVLNRDNVGLILLLKPKASKKSVAKEEKEREEARLCIATTHILYNPKRGDCKLAQLQVLLANLDRIAFKHSTLDAQNPQHLKPVYHPTILCGDFNCVNSSDLYNFIINSKLENYKCLNRASMSGQYESSRNAIAIDRTLLPQHLGISDQCQFEEEVEKRLRDYVSKEKSRLSERCAENDLEYDLEIKSKCTFGGEHLAHYFDFKSVYNHFDSENRAEVTTCVQEFKKTVDYIFYNSNEVDEASADLKLLARLELFTEDKVRDIILPEKNYPSDHFSLAAKFILD